MSGSAKFICGTVPRGAFARHPAGRRHIPTRIAWWHEETMKLPGLSMSGTRQVLLTAFELAAFYTRVDFQRARRADEALIVLTVGAPADFDGPGGVLAMAEVRSLYDPAPRTIWFDPAEQWRRLRASEAAIYALPVTCHEIGHTLGFGHGRAGLMAPYYDPQVTTPTKAELARFFREYPELKEP